jgi:glycosyltransferase involved in cell wall biosynthesis
MSPTISLVMLTQDAEEFLDLALGSTAPYCDEVIVIDQGSKDRTVEIAWEHGAAVVHADGNFETRGEKYFRDMAVRLCKSDWLMILDADEVMSDNWIGAVKPLLAGVVDYGAVDLPYYQLMGSYEYQALDSPLWRPVFIRKHPNLECGTRPDGLTIHCNYHQSYQPPSSYRFAGASVFHLGYVQRDLMKRWRTNVLRGDYGGTAEDRLTMLGRLEANPCTGFPEVTPISRADLEQFPAVLRARYQNSYVVTMNAELNRIIDRRELHHTPYYPT